MYSEILIYLIKEIFPLLYVNFLGLTKMKHIGQFK